MTLIIKKQQQQRLEPFDPRNPVTFEAVEEQHSVDDAQILLAANRRFTDANGRKIDEDSRLIVSDLSGAIVNAEDAYQCLGCFRYGNKNERAKIIEPQVPGSTANGTPVFAERSGYCPLCWRSLRWIWLAKSLGRMLVKLLGFLLRPIFDEPSPTPPAIPRPASMMPIDRRPKNLVPTQTGEQP